MLEKSEMRAVFYILTYMLMLYLMVSRPGLNDAAKAAGKLWFGTAADIPGTGEESDKYYMREFNNTHDFGEATPANIMKVRHTITSTAS